MIVCARCAHPEAWHVTEFNQSVNSDLCRCSGDDPEANRNWCDCSEFIEGVDMAHFAYIPMVTDVYSGDYPAETPTVAYRQQYDAFRVLEGRDNFTKKVLRIVVQS